MDDGWSLASLADQLQHRRVSLLCHVLRTEEERGDRDRGQGQGAETGRESLEKALFLAFFRFFCFCFCLCRPLPFPRCPICGLVVFVDPQLNSSIIKVGQGNTGKKTWKEKPARSHSRTKPEPVPRLKKTENQIEAALSLIKIRGVRGKRKRGKTQRAL